MEDRNVKIIAEQVLTTHVRQGNPWYVNDQFDKQLGRPGARALIEQRWKYFEFILFDYLKTRPAGAFLEQIRFLDAGCGDGINLQWAVTFFRENKFNVKVTALDYNQVRIDRVREKHLADDICTASLLELPFGDQTFDIILCNHVIEHIIDYGLAIAELMRVLKAGGVLLVGVPNEGCFLGQLRNNVFQRFILNETDHVNFFTEMTLRESLCSSGFNVKNIYREGFFLPHFWIHYALNYFKWGGQILYYLGRILPSQSAGLIAYATKD